MVKQSFIVYTGFGLEKVWPKIQDLLGEAFAGRHSAELIVKTSDKPTDLMRKKWHSMCDDLAEQVPDYGAAKMDKLRWKAICMSEAIDQEWLPAWGGRGVVPFRPSSETLTKKQYCDCIEVAYMIGSHFNVVWTEPKKEHAA